MMELIESLVFVMPVVAGIIGLLQIYILYVTLKIAANSLQDFRKNQIWIDKRKDAAQVINLLNLIEKEIESLSQFYEIDHELGKYWKDLDDRFPEIKVVVYLYSKYSHSKDKILKISSEIDSVEYKINKKNSSFFYRSFASLLVTLQMSNILVDEYAMADIESYKKYYKEKLELNFQNHMKVAIDEFLAITKEKRSFYINYLQTT